VSERASGTPPAGVWCIYEGMWEIMSGGREGSLEGVRGGKGGERENIPSSKPLDKHSTFRQNHSTSTAHQSIDTTSKKLMTEVCNRKVYRSRMDPLDIVSVY
jgi:hypothetical protein